MNRGIFRILVLLLVVCWLTVSDLQAQPTEFTFQGSLKSGGADANGNFDFQFALFESLSGGSQIGSTITLNTITVSEGIFSVKLDFGNQFAGANRFLEIRVRQTGGGTFTVLSPRQIVGSSPYSVKSLNAENAATANNALQLGGVTASQFVQTNDSRLSDSRNPLPNSPNYIQNRTTQQTSSNFNISGTGTANIFSATTQFNIGGQRVLSSTGTNLFAGVGAGNANTGGFFNTFVGRNAGFSNTDGVQNAFFGANAGENNTTGTDNSFFGFSAGSRNNTGFGNSFFGFAVGNLNTTGNENSFFGRSAGLGNTTGAANSFFGVSAGDSNSTGNNLTIIGSFADTEANNLTNATAIGSRARVSQSNSLVLGSINGVNSATADTNVGIGTTAPQSKLEVRNGEITSTGLGGGRFAANNPNNQNARVLFDWFNDGMNDFPRIRYGGSGEGATNGFLIQGPGDNTKLTILNSGNVGIGTTAPQDRLEVNGIIRVITLGAAGSTPLCRNVNSQIASCSSSIRYKTDINSFNSGLNLIRRLRPVSFRWQTGGTLDLGLVAEEVAEIEPLLTTQNEKGETEGVKYDRLGVVLVNAVNEQQTQIESLEKKVDEQKEIIKKQEEQLSRQDEFLKSQQAQIDALQKFICSNNPAAEICTPQN